MTTETTSEPMVRILHTKCPDCGQIANKGRGTVGGGVTITFPAVMSLSAAKAFAAEPSTCFIGGFGCGVKGPKLLATEPVL